MFDVIRGHWRLFGHILRLPRDTPVNKAMEFYFEPSLKNTFKGRPRTTIVTTINRDIERTKLRYPTLTIRKLKMKSDLDEYRLISSNRNLWRKLSDVILSAAEAEKP